MSSFKIIVKGTDKFFVDEVTSFTGYDPAHAAFRRAVKKSGLHWQLYFDNYEALEKRMMRKRHSLNPKHAKWVRLWKWYVIERLKS